MKICVSGSGFPLILLHGYTSRPEHIKQVAVASLRRLKTDVIDLFYSDL
jgi:aryl-alcohol dehydrogenase-like predicted oxidoreductase